MSISAQDLEVAEMLRGGATYKVISEKKGKSNRDIKRVKDLMDAGIIAFNEEDKAFEAKPKVLTDIQDKIIHIVTGQAAEDAVRSAGEHSEMGREIRQFWSVKAQEKGLTLREFVRAALIFYDDYDEKTEEMEELNTNVRHAVEELNTNTVEKMKERLYYKLISHILVLKAQGKNISQQVVDDFVKDLDIISPPRTRYVITY